MDKMNKNKVLVFLDVSIDGDPFERMIFELFTNVAPKTAENFRVLCTGEKGVSLKTGRPPHYKGTFFHRIIKGHVAEAGGFLRLNGKFGESIYGAKFPGKFGESIYGGKFPDESPKLRHDGRGLLSMEIGDRDERGSLFTVTFKADHLLDGERVVFGKLVDGYEVLKKIENAGDDNKGIPSVTVKIVNSGELDDEKKREIKLKMGRDATEENNHKLKRKRKHKKSSRKRRKRRRYYTSESDSSSDTDTDFSESYTDSDSYASSLSDTSSSSDDRRKRRKRSKRDRHRRGKKDRRNEKRRRRRHKKSKRKSKRHIVIYDESDSKTGSSSQDNVAVGASDVKHKPSSNQSPLVERENEKVCHKKGEAANMSEKEEGEFARENGKHQNNDIGVGMDSDRSADRHPDVVDDLPSKSRSGSLNPRKTKSNSMSISPRTAARSPDVAAKHNRSRSPSVSRSPQPISRSRRDTPARSESSKSPVRVKRERSVSMSHPARSHSRRSRSATFSPPRRRVTRSPPRTSLKRSSLSRSPGKPSRRTVSRSPVRSSRRSVSRSSGGPPLSRRSPNPSPSPIRAPKRGYRPSYSGSPVSAGRRARSPSPVSDRGRSSSRSPSVGSPKRVRRGRGFSDRYSYVRRFRSRSRSHDRSPVRSYRYGGRVDRDRYSSYRRSPRRYRSPPRGRTPPRYRGRSRPSVSRSPTRYRGRRYSRSPSPVRRSRSPVDKHRGGSPRTLRLGRGRLPSRSKSPSKSVSSCDSQSPRGANKGRSSSSSRSPPNLVSYGDRSPDSGRD